jgi:hypothetical protein
MDQLIALLGLPLALFVTTTGLGLLAERATGARIPNGLLAPLGFCVATSLLLAAFELGAGLAVAVGLLVAGTIAGLALARSELRARLNPGWPGVAALAVYVLYAAPVLLTGNWTWSGYNFLNDTSVQFLLIDHLKSSGLDAASLPPTTGGQVTRAYLDTGYPLGTHAYAATLAGLLGSGPEVIYEAFLAGMAALAAMALGVLGGRTVFTPFLGALVGAVALASNLTYNTGLQGSIKELGVLAAIVTAAALGRELAGAADPLRYACLVGIALASVLSVYSAAGLPYAATLVATIALVVLLVHGRAALRRRWLAAGAAAGAVAVVLAAPALASIVDFYRIASVVVDATTPAGGMFGQLAYPLPALQAGGIWLDGAYQTPISPSAMAEQLTNVGLWIVAGLAVLSLVEIVRRRCPEALLAIVPAMLAAALVAPGVSPYADAKLLAIMSPSVVFAAALGLALLARAARPLGPVVAVVLAVALTGAVAVSDVFALHDSRIGPRDRMLALREAGEHLAGRGTVLFNEYEEFGKYFADAATLNVASDSITPRQVQLRTLNSIYGSYFDLDLQKLAYVESFPNILMRRSPGASRPPARYRRVFANRYYEAWSRTAGPRTIAHLPLQGPDRATATAACDRVRALARRARGVRGDVALVAARDAPQVRLDVLADAERSAGLPEDQAVPNSVSTITPGYARGPVRVARPGTYRLWVRGSFPRASYVTVDGVRRATVHGANTPGQWLGDVPVRLEAGTHQVELRIPGGSLEPGDGSIVTIGPIAFVPEQPERLETVPVARWRSLCGRELDWIELVRR